MIRPQAHRIIWYDFRKKLPEVAAVKKIGESPTPQGATLSKRVVIATSPNAISKQQFVWVPAPRMQIQQDVPLPDLIAKLNTTSLSPPKTPPKRVFTPPPAQPPVRPPRSQISIDVPAPEFSPSAPSIGNSTVDAAVASLNPAQRAGAPLPEGERPGAFSQAPVLGAPSTGAGSPGAVSVPNLAVRTVTATAAPRESAPGNRTPVLYTEIMRRLPPATLSAALPASSRRPRAIDERFRGRPVYTIVIPIENLPEYGGDWILWFTERNQTPDTATSMRAPVPFRKFEASGQRSGGSRKERWVQVAATITKDGHLGNISVLTTATPDVQQALIEDLACWEFKPATRGGTPVDVDVVIELPFLASS